jgi:hypothetical protein
MPPLNLSALTDLRVRSYLYRVLTAAGLLAVVYGALTEQELTYWLVLGGVLLGNGTATYNTPRPLKGKG